MVEVRKVVRGGLSDYVCVTTATPGKSVDSVVLYVYSEYALITGRSRFAILSVVSHIRKHRAQATRPAWNFQAQ